MATGGNTGKGAKDTVSATAPILGPVCVPMVQFDVESDEDFVKRIRLSARAYKGQFRTSINATTRVGEFLKTSPSTFAVTQLEDSLAKVNYHMRCLEVRLQQLMEIATEEKAFKELQKDLSDFQDERLATTAFATQLIHEVKLPPKPRITDPSPGKATGAIPKGGAGAGDGTAPAAAGGGGGGTARPTAKANTALRPDKLTIESTPQEMRIWTEQYRAYHRTSNFDALDERSQQAYLKQCLDATLRMRLERKLDGRTPIFGPIDSCYAYLQEEFLERYPLFNRRLTFFRYEQQQGQSMSDYVLKLRQMYEEADIHALRNEELLLFKYLCGCTNHELRNCLLYTSPSPRDRG